MRNSGLLWLVLAIAAVFTLMNSFFIVDQRQQALIVQVGAAQREINAPGKNEAGPHWKIPFMQNVVFYDKRNVGLNIEHIEVLDSNSEQLVVDAVVRYQIVSPLKFYQRLRTERDANAQLTLYANTAIRNSLAQKKRHDIISGQRAELMNQIRASLGATTAILGIEIIDVRIRKADLPPDVSEKVYEQMTATRNQQAELIRAEGDRDAAEIKAKADRERTVLIANAMRDSEQIRALGDAKRNEIYAQAYGKDAEFFRFQRALIACEEALSTGTQIVVAPQNLSICDEFINSARQASGR